MIAHPRQLLQLYFVRHGEYEGRRSDDIRKGRPDWNVFRDGCPGGEMPGQFSDRADRRWIGMPAIEGQHFALGAASLGILGHEPSHPAVRVIALWNATPAVETRQ